MNARDAYRLMKAASGLVKNAMPILYGGPDANPATFPISPAERQTYELRGMAADARVAGDLDYAKRLEARADGITLKSSGVKAAEGSSWWPWNRGGRDTPETASTSAISAPGSAAAPVGSGSGAPDADGWWADAIAGEGDWDTSNADYEGPDMSSGPWWATANEYGTMNDIWRGDSDANLLTDADNLLNSAGSLFSGWGNSPGGEATPETATSTPAAATASPAGGVAADDPAANDPALLEIDFSNSPYHRSLASAKDTLRYSADSVKRDAARDQLIQAKKYMNNPSGFKGDTEHALNNIRIKQKNGQPLNPGEQQFMAKFDAWNGGKGDREAFSGGGRSDAAVQADADARILREAKFNRMYGPPGSPKRQQQLGYGAATAASDRADAWVAQNRDQILADYRARAAGQKAQPATAKLPAAPAVGGPGPYSPGRVSPGAGMPAAMGFGNAMPTPQAAPVGQLGATQQAEDRNFGLGPPIQPGMGSKSSPARPLPKWPGPTNTTPRPYAVPTAQLAAGTGLTTRNAITTPTSVRPAAPAAPGAPQSLRLPTGAMQRRTGGSYDLDNPNPSGLLNSASQIITRAR